MSSFICDQVDFDKKYSIIELEASEDGLGETINILVNQADYSGQKVIKKMFLLIKKYNYSPTIYYAMADLMNILLNINNIQIFFQSLLIC